MTQLYFKLIFNLIPEALTAAKVRSSLLQAIIAQIDKTNNPVLLSAVLSFCSTEASVLTVYFRSGFCKIQKSGDKTDKLA